MYAVARLSGYVEEVGFRAWVSRDIAAALGVRLGDGIRLESKTGLSAARVVEIRDDVKAGVLLSVDAYMAVSGFRTLLVKRLPRVYEAEEVAVGVETAKPIDVEKLTQLLNLMVAYRCRCLATSPGSSRRKTGDGSG
jgi:predicted molibdopterin-dependent oxidoreductase YjgC